MIAGLTNNVRCCAVRVRCCSCVRTPSGNAGRHAARIADVHAELTGEAPTDNGDTGEAYRINKNGQAGQSLLLINPLFGHPEPHPVKIFSSNLDPRYQILYRWIQEGYQLD